VIIIPLRIQPTYEELRYCLRAIEQYHPEQKVMIVGELPHWVRGVMHVSYPDNPHYEYKARNIYSKVAAAFKAVDCSELLFMNDDHIILAPVTYLHHKGVMDPNDRHKYGSYTALMRNTVQVFGHVMDYDTHCPIWYNREMFSKLATLDWNKPHGYGIKTSYCALNNLQGEYYPDLKFDRAIGDITGRLYFSTGDNCNLDGLKKLFPNKSKFER
jgi:hypothetical protein